MGGLGLEDMIRNQNDFDFENLSEDNKKAVSLFAQKFLNLFTINGFIIIVLGAFFYMFVNIWVGAFFIGIGLTFVIFFKFVASVNPKLKDNEKLKK